MTPSVVEATIETRAPVAGLRVEHPLVPAGHARVRAVAVSDDGRAWQPVADPRLLSGWAWAGRTLFAYSPSVLELEWPPVAGRAVRLEVAVPDVDGRSPITRVCLRAGSR